MAGPTRKTVSKDAHAQKAKKPAPAPVKKAGHVSAVPLEKEPRAAAVPPMKETIAAPVPAQQPKLAVLKEGPNPVAKPPAQNKPERDEFLDCIGAPIESWWKFITTDYKEYYIRLLKLNMASILVQSILVAIFIVVGVSVAIGIAAFGGGADIVPGGPPVLIGGTAILLLIALLLVAWAGQSFENAAYILTDAQLNQKPYGMVEALRAVKGKTFRFVIRESAIKLIVFLPAIILFLIPALNAYSGVLTDPSSFWTAFLLAYLASFIYAIIVNTIYQFLVQFWRYGFLLEGLEVVASLKKSLALIRSRPAETIVFNLVYLAAFIVFSIPSFVFGAVSYLVLIFVHLISVMALGMPGYAIYVVTALILSALGVIFSSMAEAACRPLHYLYWKGISEKTKK